jgi:cell wall assembly regulator SMI1
MKDVWDRLHAWLDANAPAGYGNLRPGASAETIESAEMAMGLKLPDAVKSSYRIHDGQSNEPGLIGGEGWRLLSLQEIVETWAGWSQANPKAAHCVPIAWGGRGDYVFLDLDPNSPDLGRHLIQRLDRDEPDPLVGSFSSWLKDFADELEAGEFVYSDEDGGVIRTDLLDLD